MSQIEFPKMRAQELRDLADRVERGDVDGLVWAASWKVMTDEPFVMMQKCGDKELETRVVQNLTNEAPDVEDGKGLLKVSSEGEVNENAFELVSGLLHMVEMVQSLMRMK